MLMATSVWPIEIKVLQEISSYDRSEDGRIIRANIFFLCISHDDLSSGYMYVTGQTGSTPSQMFRRGQNNRNMSTPIECNMKK